jgi:hypothetical protein
MMRAVVELFGNWLNTSLKNGRLGDGELSSLWFRQARRAQGPEGLKSLAGDQVPNSCKD